MGVIHWHLVYPQELRYDPAFQALAGRLWQGFLEGRLRPDRQG